MTEAAALETVALAGNPNAGKTTLFNALTGSNQKTGNYAGVTVERKSGQMFTPHGKKLRLVDLPGCYSLEGGSPDQEIARKVLLGQMEDEPLPDLVVCVVDASNLERHLMLTLEVIETGRPVVVALNMVDCAERMGLRLDPAKLSEELGVPVVPTQANASRGIVELKQAMRHPFPPVADASWKTPDPERSAANRRERVLRICEVAARRPDAESASFGDRLDAWLLNPVWGWFFLIGMMILVFWTIFSFAEVPMKFIETHLGNLSTWVGAHIPPGDLNSLVTDGAIAGVSGVLVFLPQIILLFFFIGLLESSGYMARAAYLMDGVMAKAGLSGKSFLPLFSSHACAIPGIMSTRTIDSSKERLVTMFVAPWMSCSARLPVYFLLIPLLIPKGEKWMQALVLFYIYCTGIATAFIVARVIRGRMGEDKVANHFLLELPAYRAPQWGYIFRHVFERAWAFVAKAGTLILGLSVLLWALSTYPKKPDTEDKGELLAYSAIGRIGHFIEPVVKPLGFDGRTGTAVLTSFAARETFNTTMGVMYHVEDGDDEEQSRNMLREQLSAATWPDGRPLYTPLTAISLLVFYIYALQCLPTSAVVTRESGSWKWAAKQFVFMTVFAYTMSLLVYQAGKLLGYA